MLSLKCLGLSLHQCDSILSRSEKKKENRQRNVLKRVAHLVPDVFNLLFRVPLFSF